MRLITYAFFYFLFSTATAWGYQCTQGLKGPIKFGIRGSPIHQADLNLYLNEGLNCSAHGEITYHQRTLKLLEDEYRQLGLLP